MASPKTEATLFKCAVCPFLEKGDLNKTDLLSIPRTVVAGRPDRVAGRVNYISALFHSPGPAAL